MKRKYEPAPHLTIAAHPNGTSYWISINSAAYEALGRPKRVALQYSARRMAIKVDPRPTNSRIVREVVKQYVGARYVQVIKGGAALLIGAGLKPGFYASFDRPDVFTYRPAPIDNLL